jgi:ParB-like chromosome segregation protein Spo0J
MTNNSIAIELASTDSLVPYARNARTHSDSQVAQIAASIKEFGWTNPILIDGDNGVVAGHGRLLAAQKLGLTEVPVIQLHGLTDTKKRAYILADNRIAINSGWDTEMLGLELQELGSEIDLTLAGFSLSEIDSILEDGWSSDLGAIESTEANLDGIRDRIVIQLDGTFVEEVTGAIRAYCDEHAINVEFS